MTTTEHDSVGDVEGTGSDKGSRKAKRHGIGRGKRAKAVGAASLASLASDVASAGQPAEILEGTFDPYGAETAVGEGAGGGGGGAGTAGTAGTVGAGVWRTSSDADARRAASEPPQSGTTAVLPVPTEPSPKPQRGGSKADKRTVIVVGGEPRADLLPPEVRAQRHRAKTARRALLWLVVVVVVVLLAIAGSVYLAMNAQTQLVNEQASTQSILLQQQKYSAVQQVQGQVDLIKAGQQVGASTEIDWKTYLTKLQGTLPNGTAIVTVSIDSASPLAPYAQATAPLQGSRIATLSFSATTPTLPDVRAWLDALATLPGFADAVPGTITQNADGTYTADVTMHINKDAFDGRFSTKKGK
jgi:Tfp pilus assembly protein PilN